MKKTFKLGNGIFGEGRPKVCVPVTAGSREEIWKKAERIAALPAELVEWRADHYAGICKEKKMLEVLGGLKKRLAPKALLFTVRTRGEGGCFLGGKEDYYRLCQAAAKSGYADLADVEAFLDEGRSKEEIRRLQSLGIRVVASNHDFEKTPSVEEMVYRLKRMEEMGADAAKLAVMPGSAQDVLNLLQATLTADKILSIPVVTMSMGERGVISRVCGRLTGSAMTFAAFGEASAPGQIQAEQMEEILKVM